MADDLYIYPLPAIPPLSTTITTVPRHERYTLGVGNVLCVKHSMDKMIDIGTFCLQFRHEQNVAQNLKDG